MDYEGIIKRVQIFRGKPLAIERLSGGVTNANFKVVAGGRKYVARFGFKANKYLGLNRGREIYNYNVIAKAGLGPRVIKFYPHHNMLLVEYVEGKVATPAISKKPIIINAVAKTLNQIHNAAKFRGVFNPFTVSESYFKLVSNSWVPPQAKKLPADLAKLKLRLRQLDLSYSCHLDVFAPNILLQGNRVKLLDWEYSAKSDYRFDLATFSAMSEFDPGHDKLLIKSYGRKDLDMEQLNIAKAIMMIREIGWDLVQVKYSKLDFDYKKYTFNNIRKYAKVLRYLKI
jgi:thiamine kinase-like enzyme